jgi:hypothetical protein
MLPHSQLLLNRQCLEVKVFQRIDDELADNETQRGTAKRAAREGNYTEENF